MTYKVIIKPSAEADLKEIYQWYNSKKDGLGERFIDELENKIHVLEANPESFQKRYKAIRFLLVKKFPYCIHYTVEGENVFVHAILSTSRNPKIWKG